MLMNSLRIMDAYTHVQEKGEVCPANWEEGKKLNANRAGVLEYLQINFNHLNSCKI